MVSFCQTLLPGMQHEKPREYGAQLCAAFGEPNSVEVDAAGKAMAATWVACDADGVDPTSCAELLRGSSSQRVMLRDEMVAHAEPMPHHDYIYSTREYGVNDAGTCRITAEQAAELKQVSDSIAVDLGKCSVTARCGKLVKNAVTLDVVERFIRGDVMSEGLRDRYSHAIATNRYGDVDAPLISAMAEEEAGLMPDVAAKAVRALGGK